MLAVSVLGLPRPPAAMLADMKAGHAEALLADVQESATTPAVHSFELERRGSEAVTEVQRRTKARLDSCMSTITIPEDCLTQSMKATMLKWDPDEKWAFSTSVETERAKLEEEIKKCMCKPQSQLGEQTRSAAQYCGNSKRIVYHGARMMPAILLPRSAGPDAGYISPLQMPRVMVRENEVIYHASRSQSLEAKHHTQTITWYPINGRQSRGLKWPTKVTFPQGFAEEGSAGDDLTVSSSPWGKGSVERKRQLKFSYMKKAPGGLVQTPIHYAMVGEAITDVSIGKLNSEPGVVVTEQFKSYLMLPNSSGVENLYFSKDEWDKHHDDQKDPFIAGHSFPDDILLSSRAVETKLVIPHPEGFIGMLPGSGSVTRVTKIYCRDLIQWFTCNKAIMPMADNAHNKKDGSKCEEQYRIYATGGNDHQDFKITKKMYNEKSPWREACIEEVQTLETAIEAIKGKKPWAQAPNALQSNSVGNVVGFALQTGLATALATKSASAQAMGPAGMNTAVQLKALSTQHALAAGTLMREMTSPTAKLVAGLIKCGFGVATAVIAPLMCIPLMVTATKMLVSLIKGKQVALPAPPSWESDLLWTEQYANELTKVVKEENGVSAFSMQTMQQVVCVVGALNSAAATASPILPEQVEMYKAQEGVEADALREVRNRMTQSLVLEGVVLSIKAAEHRVLDNMNEPEPFNSLMVSQRAQSGRSVPVERQQRRPLLSSGNDMGIVNNNEDDEQDMPEQQASDQQQQLQEEYNGPSNAPTMEDYWNNHQ